MRSQNEISIGIVGTKFVGRAHSNAYLNAAHFFDLPAQPVLGAACGRDVSNLHAFARRFGWRSTETSWERLVERDDIDLIDICTPMRSTCRSPSQLPRLAKTFFARSRWP